MKMITKKKNKCYHKLKRNQIFLTGRSGDLFRFKFSSLILSVFFNRARWQDLSK